MKHLIDKYLNDTITNLELEELCDWLKKPTHQIEFETYLNELSDINIVLQDIDYKRAYQSILGGVQENQKPVRRLFAKWIKYAAVVTLFLGLGYVYQQGYFKNEVDHHISDENLPKVNINSIEVGTDKAILTFEDGRSVALEKGKAYDAENLNSNGEKLVYKNATNSTAEIVYNYLTIPRGGQFSLKLSDGTEIWLNSESQLKYPVNFIKGESRKVELVYGEAYFDVSPSTQNNGSKFIVINQNQEVEVLGTEFNIKAYKEESYVYTTLVEGKVTVSNSISKQSLIPNQQSKINLKSKDIAITTVDVYSETSWRKGLFSFKSMPLKEIMVVLSRWYNIEVEFTDTKLEKIRFNGVLSKNDKIEEILEVIKNTKFINAYEIKDKKVTIN